MPPDPVRTDETKSWLGVAQKDLRRADVLKETIPPDLEGVLFFCQQAAEKAWKAFLTWHDVVFRKTHNLDEIGGQCAAIDSSLTETAANAHWLTSFASRFRYPGAEYVPDAEEVDRAIATARAVFNAVLERIPADARP
jgi:HEPN domain-containing protein